MDRIFEQHYTGNALDVDETVAFWALAFPAEASIEKVVVAETGTNTTSIAFTVDVFNSPVAEGKDPRVQSLYKVVPSQVKSASALAMELFVASGGAYRNVVGTDVTPEHKIYVQVTAASAPGASTFDIAIAGVIPS